jgi:hypothetical protein
MLASLFPYDEKSCTDRIFKYLPNDVRGPIIAAWGIRGLKAALRDTDDKVQSVVHDALVAGDIDHAAFEEGLTAETLVRWIPLADLWSFWRAGKLSKQAINKALATAYELYLFDGRWFLDTLQAKGGSARGTDVLAEGLTKDELVAWIRKIAETGDGTPKGIVAALGWEKIVAKTTNDVLVSVLDAIVAKVGLVVAPTKERESTPKLDQKQAHAPASVPGHAPSSGELDAGADDRAWSKPPAPLEIPQVIASPAAITTPTEEAINVVLEDELIIAPNMLDALDGPEDDVDPTQIKPMTDRPPPYRAGPKRK